MNQIEPKCVILGHTGVGKTSMVNKYCRGQMGQTTATIGAAFMKKTVSLEDWKIVLQIWDTAGQERFRSMAPMYYRGANAAILVFDVTDQNTLTQVEEWEKELRRDAMNDSSDIVMVLAANKTDLKTADKSILERATNYAKSINAELFETSAKSGKGIEDLFGYVAKQLLQAEKQRQREAEEANKLRKIKLSGRRSTGERKGGCC